MKAVFKLPLILTTIIGSASTLLPYLDLSTPLTEDQKITDFFGIKPMPGYTHEVGIGVGGAMFLALVITLIAHRQTIVLWSKPLSVAWLLLRCCTSILTLAMLSVMVLA